jgi:hypothetical protein
MASLRRVSSTGFPLRVILTCSALLQIYSYAFVILYSLWLGGIDLVIPPKVAFLSTVVMLLGLTVGDVVTAWKNRLSGLQQLGLSIWRLVGESVLTFGLFYLGYALFRQPLSFIDLRSLSNDVRAVASIGTLSLVAFSVVAIFDLLDLRRKGSLPLLVDVRESA